jgi:hypothetical protein
MSTTAAPVTVGNSGVKFAKIVFWAAGIYGVLVLTPLYFIFNLIGVKDPPPVTHPLFYYGFVGLGLVWQAAFMIIATCPVRYRPMMIAACLEKLSYGVAAWVLYAQGRLHIVDAYIESADLVWLVVFIVAYIKTPVRANEGY